MVNCICKKNRNKSDEPFEVQFSPLATRIYHQYFNLMSARCSTDLPVEPFEDLPSLEYFTRCIKKLMKVAGIKKNVTSYTARHTFATDWIRNSGCVVTLMKILGHTNLKTTQIYLNTLTEDRVRKATEVYSRSSFHQN